MMHPSKPIRTFDKLICIKPNNLITYWADSMSCVYYDGYIHAIGSADRAIYPTKNHYVFDTHGNLIHMINAPWASAKSEINLSKINGKIYTVGGTINNNEIWSFDPSVAGYTASSWVLVNDSAVSSIGNRYMAWSGDVNGWFYIGGGYGGGAENNKVYKTQNFTNWTHCATLPTDILKISACGSTVFNNKIYLIGGATNFPTDDVNGLYASEVKGYVYVFDPANNSFTKLLEDQNKFGYIWIDAISIDNYIYVSKGFVSTAQGSSHSPVLNQGNKRGMLRSSDGITWSEINLRYGDYYFYERHRPGVVNVLNTPYFLGGFSSNDMWKIV